MKELPQSALSALSLLALPASDNSKINAVRAMRMTPEELAKIGRWELNLLARALGVYQDEKTKKLWLAFSVLDQATAVISKARELYDELTKDPAALCESYYKLLMEEEELLEKNKGLKQKLEQAEEKAAQQAADSKRLRSKLRNLARGIERYLTEGAATNQQRKTA